MQRTTKSAHIWQNKRLLTRKELKEDLNEKITSNNDSVKLEILQNGLKRSLQIKECCDLGS